MAITNTYSSVAPDIIAADGTALVTLGLSAQSGMLEEPIDIVLVLEDTNLLGTSIKDEIRNGARALVERIAVASGSEYYMPFGKGISMGLVIYNTQAVTSVRLTAETIEMDAGISAMDDRDVGVNHATAIELAAGMLASSTGKKAIVIFSYNAATLGGDGKAQTDAAKAAGIQIFGLGPETRRADLSRWVSAPEDFYLCINVGGEKMNTVFDIVGERLTLGNTTGIELKSYVSTDFEILRIVSTSHGTASLTDAQNLSWQPGNLGQNAPETGELVYEIRHVGSVLGKKSATLTNVLSSASEPDITISNPELVVIAVCGGTGSYVPEGNPEPVEILVPGCKDAVQSSLGAVGLASLGRVVQVDFVLKAVCPGKRVAVTLLLEELDSQGKAYPRGAKHLLIPAGTGTACTDVEIKCVEFSVPELLDPSGNTGSICNERKFQARAIANYVDSDFVYCDPVKQTV